MAYRYAWWAWLVVLGLSGGLANAGADELQPPQDQQDLRWLNAEIEDYVPYQTAGASDVAAPPTAAREDADTRTVNAGDVRPRPTLSVSLRLGP